MFEWDLLNLLQPENDARLALVVLNQPLNPELDLLNRLWKKAVITACVDGGTNELYDNVVDDRGKFLPDLITGDFDSAREEVLQFYRERDVEIIHTPDQDHTDFTKCLKIILERQKLIKIDCVVVMGGFGGRVDHQFSNCDTLFTALKLDPSLPICFMSTQTVGCLLQKGSHRLHVETGMEGKHCGLIPLSGRCECVTTTGLKWNLDHQPMAFGELISTSNTWNGDEVVTVETDNPLLWTMSVQLK